MIYSLAVILLLTACSNEKADEQQEVPKQEQGAIVMNEALLGKWQGLIELPQMPLEIVLSLQQDGGNFSIPAQRLSEYSFESVDYDGQKVEMTIDLAGSLIKIEGTLDKNQINATFTQNGQTYPLVLKPYTEAKVTYDELTVPVEGGELKVALQMPDNPTGDLVIIHAGSGPTNKDGNTIGSGKNNSLKMIAEELAAQGIASVRFDKRGIGENTALMTKEANLTFTHYINDVSAIVTYMKQDSRFTSIHLLGHSEGALIMTLAAQHDGIASLIVVAGAGRPADEILLEQLSASLPPNLLNESKVALQKLKAGEMVANVSNELMALFRPSVQPYMRSWLQYDPQQEIKKVTAPILIIQGKKDIQITEIDAKALAIGNEKATVRYFEQMNHVLKDIKGDYQENIASYTTPELPLANGLIEEIVKFIK